MTGNYIQGADGAVTSLDGDLTVGAGREVDIQAGVLDGNGTIHGNLRMSGTLSPGHSPGEWHVVGDLVMEPGSVLRMEIGPGGYDHLYVSGAFIYEGGNLFIDFLPGANPTFADSFHLFDFNSTTGWFDPASITVTGLDPLLRLSFDPGTGMVMVDHLAPEPAAFGMAVLGLAALGLRRYRAISK